MLKSLVLGLGALAALASAQTAIQASNSLIHYYGRWDTTQTSWWAGTGFKLNVNGLSSLSVTFGSLTVANMQISVSVNYGAWTYMTVSAGTTSIPITGANASGNTVVRIDSPQWQNNRMQISSLTLNSGATLEPYVPSNLVFQFIGDSLSAGQYLTDGVNHCWDALTGEAFKAETYITAQPGIALTDVASYENPHGMIVQYFDTEDTGYVYDSSHDYTTAWNFAKDSPAPTHIISYLGANDNGQNVAQATFVQTYLTFLGKLRAIYPTQPIFILTDWGWPQSNGQVGYYYAGAFQQILSEWEAQGDKNTKLVDTTGWVAYADIFADNSHPTDAGHVKIAGEFEAWLMQNGVNPEPSWPSGSGTAAPSSTAPTSVSPPPSSTVAPPTSTGGSTGGAAHWAQCGGIGYTGATTCASPYTCTVVNSYYSQCL